MVRGNINVPTNKLMFSRYSIKRRHVVSYLKVMNEWKEFNTNLPPTTHHPNPKTPNPKHPKNPHVPIQAIPLPIYESYIPHGLDLCNQSS